MNEISENKNTSGLIDAKTLLKELFPNPDCRPSLRWLRMKVEDNSIPFVHIGRLCFFDYRLVKAHFDSEMMKNLKEKS